MAKKDIITQARAAAWGAETSYLQGLALEAIKVIVAHGSPETKRPLAILTAYHCVGLWWPGDYFSTRQQERECKASSEKAMTDLQELLQGE